MSKATLAKYREVYFLAVLLSMLMLPSAALRAQLVLSGGGLTLVQEGPAATAAGDPVPSNLALAGTAFGSSELGPELGLAYHFIDNLNDGSYGNAYSWIGGDANPFFDAFAGIDLGATPVANVQSIAFGRSNVLSGDVCEGGVCTDRHLGFYTLEYTQVPNPSDDLDIDSTGNPATGWAEIGTFDYGTSDGPNTNYNNTWQRHRYNFDAVNATGLRLLVPGTGLGGGTAIDEIELYDVPGEFVPPPPPPPPFAITPEAGFAIAWDGNDGDFFDPTPPPDGAIVPDNLALEPGATAFASSELGPQLGITFHVIDNLNDGYYGNSNSWISGDSDPGPKAYAGISLPGMYRVDSIAFGRDNGNGEVDDSFEGTDACGGQCDDRWSGLYTLQYTQIDDPANGTDTGDPATGWANIGTLAYTGSTADGPGGDFTGYLRHEFGVSLNDQPITASGIRIIVPSIGIGGGTDLDEIEIYGSIFQAMPCDLNGDSVCDVNDINLLTMKVIEQSQDLAFDLSGDGKVDQEDRRVWVEELFPTWFGDANLDGEFNSTDLVDVLAAGTYEVNVDSDWAGGDFNGDARTNSSDLVTALAGGGYEQGPRPAVASVPEPASVWLIALGTLAIAAKRRRVAGCKSA